MSKVCLLITGVQGQRLGITVEDPSEAGGKRVTSFNDKPIWIAQLLNTISMKGGWQFELGGMVQSKGYSGNLLEIPKESDPSTLLRK